ncbi:YqgE/AlgH family protein [Thalassovita sp.]|uniref:YqgE/AlgH family protein n=1 Tax=Thalassovita sp. TaxID=1979401 RepID=UPI002881D40C|nr:YqgE/AlgH family protein [Thalassovita sp.]MDF1803280.1 YqgE/AlgH family protein [Thalassovita sp.]
MEQQQTSLNLTGKLLIAMPAMGDSRFEQSVVLICAHSEDGAMGLIVNKPTGEVALSDMLEQLSIRHGPGSRQMDVSFGGPVEPGRGFVLHSLDYVSTVNTLRVDGGFGMTATLDILEALARGQGPERALVVIGYAGWGPGQLESELSQNAWLTCDANMTLVFDLPDKAKWDGALKSLGVDALLLSSDAGRA